MNTKIICNFINSGRKELLLGCKDSVVRLSRDNDVIMVELKENVDDDFCWVFDINCDDIKPLVVAKTIAAFLEA